MARKTQRLKFWVWLTVPLLAGLGAFSGYRVYSAYMNKNKILAAIIDRLQADSRIAEVLVTGVSFNPVNQQHMTTIKFLEYTSSGKPLTPKYFAFAGNLIQFQSLVVRFDDMLVERGDPLRGRSAYLFWKVFILNGKDTQEYVITPVNSIPAGYKVEGPQTDFEKRLWQDFWAFALDSKLAISKGIKNAQVEAPGTKFVPGILYTLKIEHDGGIRIDTAEIPEVLKGEKL